MYYKCSKTLVNGVTMILKNLEDIVLDKQGLDKKKNKFLHSYGLEINRQYAV